MNRSLRKLAVFAIAGLSAGAAGARAQQSASITEDSAKPTIVAAPAASVPHVFAFAVSTKSADARRLVEVALDQYENVLLDRSEQSARQATEKDPDFALAYAVWSFASRRTQPNVQALHKAEALVSKASADEQLLVKFLTSVQKSDMLPAIVSMNELLARFPKDTHALYLTSEWLYFQQDYDRSVRMMEQIIKIDPNFAPAFNMLGYAKVETGDPDATKALAYLKRYVELQPGQPNPEDSLGEVSRYAGDDKGSLEHYSAALKITPNFITSQIGLGDTYTLMGKFENARAEYHKAWLMANNDRDRMHIEFQKAMVNFWEGNKTAGLQALAELDEKAQVLKDPYSVFEVQETRALLAAEPGEKIERLQAMEKIYSVPVPGMIGADRNTSLAAVLRDEARIHAELQQLQAADSAIAKLELLAAKSRDLIVGNCFESAKGYVFFARHDFQSAEDQLSADPHSPLAIKRLATAREMTGDGMGAESAQLRLKYLRAPTPEWYLATHPDKVSAK